MSKVSGAIYARPERRERAVSDFLPMVVSETFPDELGTIEKQLQYSIELRLSYRAWIDYNIPDVVKSNTYRMARQALCQEIFGEFYSPMMRLRLEIEQHSWPEAKAIIQELHDTMFDWMNP